MMYCFVQMYMHPTLIDIKDVGEMFGLNTLSVIDDDPDFDDFIAENLITNRENLSSVLKDDFTAFAHILLHQIDDDYFSMFVTSSVRGEGRTMIVANLGVALAALGKRVLLIDFDLTSPTLGSFFMDEVNYENTINAVYFDDVSVDDALVRVNPNLYLLMARLDKRPIGIDLFAKKLVARLESEFDVVIMDTPPVGENSDTLYFSSISQNARPVCDPPRLRRLRSDLRKHRKAEQGGHVAPRRGCQSRAHDDLPAGRRQNIKRRDGTGDRYKPDPPEAPLLQKEDSRARKTETKVQSG